MTLPPFDDGNGRITRARTDRALAQAKHNPVRFYSHSAAIIAKRSEYYAVLEKTQKGSLEITGWAHWFLSTLIDAVALSKMRFQQALYKTRFWNRHARTVLNEREIKSLSRLLDSCGEAFTDGISTSKYRSLARVSKATATRELAELVRKGCLVRLPGGGRSTRYRLADIDTGGYRHWWISTLAAMWCTHSGHGAHQTIVFSTFCQSTPGALILATAVRERS